MKSYTVGDRTFHDLGEALRFAVDDVVVFPLPGVTALAYVDAWGLGHGDMRLNIRGWEWPHIEYDGAAFFTGETFE